MSTDTLPDWITEGATVAELERGRYTFTTVSRVTPTTATLANGSRWRLTDMTKFGEKRKAVYYGTDHPTMLVSAAAARGELARRRLMRLHDEISDLIRDGARGVDDALAALDQIAEAVAAARAQITEGAQP